MALSWWSLQKRTPVWGLWRTAHCTLHTALRNCGDDVRLWEPMQDSEDQPSPAAHISNLQSVSAALWPLAPLWHGAAFPAAACSLQSAVCSWSLVSGELGIGRERAACPCTEMEPKQASSSSHAYGCIPTVRSVGLDLIRSSSFAIYHHL